MFEGYESAKAARRDENRTTGQGFSSWSHFVSMLFGQLPGQDSLHGIEAGALYHFVVKPLRCSTLSYANEHRTHELYKKIFEEAVQMFAVGTPGTQLGLSFS